MIVRNITVICSLSFVTFQEVDVRDYYFHLAFFDQLTPKFSLENNQDIQVDFCTKEFGLYVVINSKVNDNLSIHPRMKRDGKS